MGRRKKTTREQQKKIQWFLNFIAIENFEELDDEERAELAGAIEGYTHYQKLGEQQEYPSASKKVMGELKSLINPKRLASFQNELKKYFEFLILGIERTHDMTTTGWTKPEDADFYPHLGTTSITININPIVIDIDSSVEGLGFEHNEKNGRPIESRLKPGSIKNAVINTTYKSSFKESFFLYSFISLINGKKINAFKKCPECENWFINLTKREKTFCNNRCAAKAKGREKRDNLNMRIAAGDPEAIRKKNIEAAKSRTRSSRAYEKSVKSGKISKNPRKQYWDFEKGTFTE